MSPVCSIQQFLITTAAPPPPMMSMPSPVPVPTPNLTPLKVVCTEESSVIENSVVLELFVITVEGMVEISQRAQLELEVPEELFPQAPPVLVMFMTRLP